MDYSPLKKPLILGIPFYEGSPELLVEEISNTIETDQIAANNVQFTDQSIKNRCICPAGAHVTVEANKDPNYKFIIDQFHLIIPDGMPIVWIGNYLGYKQMKRCYGPDVFKIALRNTSPKKINHFLCGGKPGVAEELRDICKSEFGNSNVVGTYSPPFRELKDEEFEALAKTINQLNTDIVWIGLGAPKQDKFAFKLSQYTRVSFIITVGAAFDFHTHRIKQAPVWIQQAGLEWLFRLITEPRRLWKRYLEIIPKFIYLTIRSAIRNELK